MKFQLKFRDFLLLMCLCLAKYSVGFLIGDVIPIFPVLIQQFFNETTSSVKLNTTETPTFSYNHLALLYGTKSLTQIIISPITGILIDRIGDKIILLSGLFFQLFVYLIYGLSNEYFMFIIGRIVQAYQAVAIMCAIESIVARNYKQCKIRGIFIGCASFSLNLGCSFGPLYGGWTFEYYNRYYSFLIPMNVTILNLILYCGLMVYNRYFDKSRFISEDNSNISNVKSDSSETIPNHASYAEMKSKNSIFKPYYQMLTDPYFLIGLATYPLLFTTTYIYLASVPRYMKEKFDSTESKQGFVWIFNLVGYLFSLPLIYFLNDRFAKFRHVSLTILTSIHAICIFILPFMNIWWLIALPLTFINNIHLLQEALQSPIMATCVEQRHSKAFGSMSGMLTLAIACTSAIGSIGGPILLKLIGFQWINIILGVISLIYAPMYLFFKRFVQEEIKE